MRRLLGVMVALVGVAVAAGLGGLAAWQLREPAPTAEAEPAPTPKPTARPAPKKSSGLSRPSPKPCLAAPTGEGLADEGVTSSQGLTHAQVKGAMDAFVPHTLDCVPEGTAPSGTVRLTITVGCDGLVSDVQVDDRGGLPGEMVKCVQETLTYAPFPAHDLPDGEQFAYPLTFSF